jgi:tetratricopeptide (TPR) repeat protein
MWAVFLFSSALAEVPAPDYRAALLDRIEQETDRLLENGEPEQALAHIREFRAEVADDPRLAYEEALVLRHLDRTREAEKLLTVVLHGDPSLAAAWYDLGEIHLSKNALEEAEKAFQQAATLTADHPQGWAGPYRLAEIAGFRGDPEAFAGHLQEALRRGFSFQRTVAADPRWGAFLKNPALAAVLRQLTTVVGEEEVLESWSITEPENP